MSAIEEGIYWLIEANINGPAYYTGEHDSSSLPKYSDNPLEAKRYGRLSIALTERHRLKLIGKPVEHEFSL